MKCGIVKAPITVTCEFFKFLSRLYKDTPVKDIDFRVVNWLAAAYLGNNEISRANVYERKLQD